MPKTVVHAVNKLLFPFIWNKHKEPIACSSAVAPRLRGLGVVHVATKILSLRAIWLRQLLLSQNTIPWASIFSFHLHQVFQQDMETFFSRDKIPAYLIKKLPKFSQSIVHTWLQLKGHRDNSSWSVWKTNTVPLPLAELTARSTYSILLESSLTPHKAIEKFATMQIDVHWPSVWRSLLLWRFVRSAADTNYYNFHGRLATADRLIRFGMKVDKKCFCREQETAIHLFFHCSVAKTVWAWMSPLHRNRCRFDRLPPDASMALRLAKSTFRFSVKLEHRHCLLTKFEEEWLLRGLVGSITGDNTVSFSKDFMS